MHRKAPLGSFLWASGLVVAFTIATVGAALLGNLHGPTLSPFIPICATLWGIGDLLTAYLLLTQFNVNGMRVFAVLSGAYAVSGVLTIPYIGFFPNLFFFPPLTLGFQQISVWLWITWHIAFPFVVGGYHLLDRTLSVRITSGAGVRRWTLGTMIFVAVVSALIVATIYGARNALPTIVIAGTFQSLFASTVAPIIFAANLLAAAAILAASKRPNTLQLWLAVALATAALDGALNAYSSGRYTISWYVGKLGTLTTASIVLMVLLSELSRLYRRLSDLATIDALTGLPNRQSFDSDARFALQMYQRGAPDLAFLILDVDFFKQYNDTYGHQQGDACLRNVSASLRRTCTRSIDLVGRFGGEEFVVLLPGTDRDGALRVAEAIRSNVEALRIEHAASSIATVVTVSIGIALTSHVAIASPARDAYLEELVRGADTALYAAKQKRNTVAIAQASAVPAS